MFLLHFPSRLKYSYFHESVSQKKKKQWDGKILRKHRVIIPHSVNPRCVYNIITQIDVFKSGLGYCRLYWDFVSPTSVICLRVRSFFR